VRDRGGERGWWWVPHARETTTATHTPPPPPLLSGSSYQPIVTFVRLFVVLTHRGFLKPSKTGISQPSVHPSN
jgi:hypothetical protein